jgi:hypothetical protein
VRLLKLLLVQGTIERDITVAEFFQRAGLGWTFG